MSIKRLFRSKKEPKPPVGDLVPVLGNDDLMYRYIVKLTNSTQHFSAPLLSFRGQGEHKAIKFHCVGVELGARCPFRHLWKEKVADAKTFVLIVHAAIADDEKYFDYLFCTPKIQMEELISIEDTDKNLLVLFEHASNEELEKRSSEPLHPKFKEWIETLQTQHTVAHYPVCLETGRGMEAAMDWLIGHVTAPAPEPEVKKSRSALHWLAEVGKKVLTVGATPKTPVEAK